jgi:hypothetical protein
MTILALAAALGGCALNADFDRVRPEIITDDIHAWVGRDAIAASGAKPSSLPLTDDERLLRDLAYPLVEPVYERNRWYSAIAEYGLTHSREQPAPPIERARYWDRLQETYHRSEISLYAQLAVDARNDVLRIEPFFSVAGRVKDMDRKRVASLDHIANAIAAERDNAARRNRENGAVIAWVCRALPQRAASYRFALERLVVSVPSPASVDAEQAIGLLKRQALLHCQVEPAARGRMVARYFPAGAATAGGTAPQPRQLLPPSAGLAPAPAP